MLHHHCCNVASPLLPCCFITTAMLHHHFCPVASPLCYVASSLLPCCITTVLCFITTTAMLHHHFCHVASPLCYVSSPLLPCCITTCPHAVCTYIRSARAPVSAFAIPSRTLMPHTTESVKMCGVAVINVICACFPGCRWSG